MPAASLSEYWWPSTDVTLGRSGSLAPGTYELRLFANNTFTRLTISNALTIEASPIVSAGPTAVAPGGNLTVSWAGISAPTATDWIALVPLNGADASYVAFGYTAGAPGGTLSLQVPASAAPGIYEVRLFAQNTFVRLALGNIVTVVPTLTMNPASVAPGGTVTVMWAGIAAPMTTDWSALAPLNAPDTNYVAWAYASGRPADSVQFVLPSSLAAGAYELRLFAHGTFTRVAVSNIVTVTAPGPTLAASPINATGTSTIVAQWQGIAAPTANDWVGVYAAGASDSNYLARVFTGGGASGTASIVLPGVAPGAYELRLFANNTFTRLATSNSFNVVQGPVVNASPAVGANGTLRHLGRNSPPASTIGLRWLRERRTAATSRGLYDWLPAAKTLLPRHFTRTTSCASSRRTA